MIVFEMHPKLVSDTIYVADLLLSRLVLMNDQRFPWLILVPRITGKIEIHELSIDEQRILLHESCSVAKTLKNICNSDKINIANIGNIVSQLHLHIVARNKLDIAWPSPAWGFGKALVYDSAVAEKFISKFVSKIPKTLLVRSDG